MPILEAVRLALVQIRVQKLKTFFTLFGVMLGVMFLIVVVSVVEGMRRYVERDLIGSFMTLNAIEIRRSPQFQMGDVDADRVREWNRRPALYERDTSAILAAVPAGFRHALQNDALLTVVSRYAPPKSLMVRGTSHTYFGIKNLQITNGRPFLEQEDRLRASVAVIGDDVRERFFPGLDPVGRTVRIAGMPYQVIGVAKKQGTTFGMSLDDFIIVPYSSPVRPLMAAAPGEIGTIVVQGPNETALVAGRESVRQALRSLHRLRADREDDFALENAATSLEFFDKIKGYLVAAGVVLPAVGLVVGAIVIMNIMLVAVAERTHEIGIRKSLGARRRDILAQFLIESATVSTLGAALGVGVGALIAMAAAAVSPLPTHVAPWSVVVSVMLGAGIGVAAGVYPASRASRLDPIAALRAES